MNSPTLSQSAAPFERFAEPSDRAYELAAEVDHLLHVAGFTDLPLRSMARVIDTKLKAFDKKYAAMETALAFAVQVAQHNGAGESEMRAIHDHIAKGDEA